MMTVDEWLTRIRLGEDTTLELKRVMMRSETIVEGPHRESMADELAAMGNAQGGTLILGVDDKPMETDVDGFLSHVKGNYLVGERVSVNLIRDGKRMSVAMTFAR